MGQKLSSQSLRHHIEEDFGGCFYYPCFSGCTPSGSFACSAISGSEHSTVLYVSNHYNNQQQKNENNVKHNNTSKLPNEFDPTEAIVRILLKKNSCEDDNVSPRLFCGTTGTPTSVSIHQYLSELVGGAPIEIPQCEDNPSSDIDATVEGTGSYTITKEFIGKLIAKCRVILRTSSSPLSGTITCMHPNLAPVLRVDETKNAFYIVTEKQPYTLDGLIHFNPLILMKNHALRMFCLYQILQALAHCHSNGITHGELQPHNILLSKNMWVSITGLQCPSVPLYTNIEAPPELSLEELQRAWMDGQISNFGYLMALNGFAKRRVGDPYFHPVMPWVMNFSVELGGWRDLSKSKFRLTKGEEQMDLQYSSGHHITDVLSELAYFNYLSRRVPIASLTRYVRSTYVPNEYPTNMERMYQWTPDECIPEFFHDSRVFRSVHHDMPDLAVPEWAKSYEDFVQKHMAALESDYVSLNLHSWIDLTFGYQLSGDAAVAAKNVPLVDPIFPRSHGLIQLFANPHPKKIVKNSLDDPGLPVIRMKKEPSLSELSSPISSTPTSTFGDTIQSRRKSKRREGTLDKPLTKIFQSPLSNFFQNSKVEANTPQYVDRVHEVSILNLNSRAKSEEVEMIETSNLSNLATPPRTTTPRLVSSAEGILGRDDTELSTANFSASAPVTPSSDSSPASESPITTRITPRTSNERPGTSIVLRNQLTCRISHIPFCMKLNPPSFLVGSRNRSQANEYFVERLLSFENTSNCAPSSACFRPVYKAPAPITPQTYVSLPHPVPNTYAQLVAQDMFAVGCIVAELFQKKPLFTMATLIEYFKGYIPSPTQNLPPLVRSTVEELINLTPSLRPSATEILERGIFPPYFHKLYFYLSKFQVITTWRERLKYTLENISIICDFPNDGLYLLMPHLSQLFLNGDVDVRVGALVDLLDPLAARLGLMPAKRLLLPILSTLYEDDDVMLQTHLVQIPIVDIIVNRLGRGTFIDHILPHLVKLFRKKGNPNQDIMIATLTKVVTMIGTPLSVKYIIYPLLECLDKPNFQHIPPALLSIGEQTGETVIVGHYLPYLFSLLQQHLLKNSKPPPSNKLSVPDIVLSLINELVPLMKGSTVLRTLVVESTALFLILLNPPNAHLLHSLATTLLHIAKAIGPDNCAKHMLRYLEQFFYNYSEFYELVEIRGVRVFATTNSLLAIGENHINISVTNFSQEADLSLNPRNGVNNNETKDAMRSIYSPEMTYKLYYQFWAIVGREMIRKEVSNSSLIERILLLYTRENNLVINFTDGPSTDPLRETEQYVPQRIPHHSSTLNLFISEVSAKKDEDEISIKIAPIPPSAWDDSQLGSDFGEPSIGLDEIQLRWEVAATFKEQTHNIKSLAVHASEGFFLTGSRDGAKCWSLSSSRSLITYSEHAHSVGTVHFLNNSLAASCDNSVHVWDYERRASVSKFFREGGDYLTFIPVQEGRSLITATAESISVLDTTSGHTVAEWLVPLQPHSSPWGTGHIRTLAVGYQEDLSFSGSIGDIPIAPNPLLWIAAGSNAGAISLLDSRTGVLMDTWRAHEGQVLKLLPYGSHFLFSSSSDRTIVLWDLRSSPPQAHRIFKGHADPVVAMALLGPDIISASGHKLARFSFNSDDSPGTVIKTDTHRLGQSKASISTLDVLKYHQMFIVGTEDGSIKVCY